MSLVLQQAGDSQGVLHELWELRRDVGKSTGKTKTRDLLRGGSAHGNNRHHSHGASGEFPGERKTQSDWEWGIRAAPAWALPSQKDPTKTTIANALLGLPLHTPLGQKCVFIVAQSQTAKSGYRLRSVILLFIKHCMDSKCVQTDCNAFETKNLCFHCKFAY